MMQMDTGARSADRNQTAPNMSGHPRWLSRLPQNFISRVSGPQNTRSSLTLPIISAALIFGIFVVDTITPYEIAAANLYVVVVLLSVRFSRKRGVVFVSATCVALTIVSYVLTQDGNFRLGVINTSISLTTIAATTYLALIIESARETAERAQAHLAHVARLTTLGELAASIAHEVNQPLTAVITNANAGTRWIQSVPPNLEKVASSIDSIVEDANRASEIIARVRALTTRAEPQKMWLDINSVIHEVLALMQNQLSENRIVTRISLGDDLPPIFGDRIQLQQVVLNLGVNAIDAINAAGDDTRELRISSSKTRPCGVEIAVKDSGIG
ncbi:MAG TPA: histidine kinase dimerization/phospho-acceptor domain-containing protein, partial [Bradyrhizobium sp.]|nr:histidine kinase dimerization/phospho-acceptor domain-containing protein [Bradyrhizobium sp.]